jgi:arylamine N-acetyltransferase
VTFADASVERIRLTGLTDAPLAQIHRVHATSIPFENFDSYSGTPVSLEVRDLEDKIVRRQRGGYCFEHNLLLQVTDRDGTNWLADVGFGGGGLLDPLPFGSGREQRVGRPGEDVEQRTEEREEEDEDGPPRLGEAMVVTSAEVVDEAPDDEEEEQEDSGEHQKRPEQVQQWPGIGEHHYHLRWGIDSDHSVASPPDDG